MTRRFLVTGGTGFIGSALVRRLVGAGHSVRVLDNGFRSDARRLADLSADVDFVKADVRDSAAVAKACAGIDSVCHLASVNGTESFYSMPTLVLDVGIRGMLNVIDGMREHGVGELFVASSSEVYQTADHVPTDERVALTVPDPLNPRFSYGGAKIASELLAIHNGRSHFDRVVVFRPHNAYGPDMGWEHVIPQLTLRIRELARDTGDPLRVPIQGTGSETRAFAYVDDVVNGISLLIERGVHLEIYNVGVDVETTVADVAHEIGGYFGRRIAIVPGASPLGGTSRRCPDVTKLRALGYVPQIGLSTGLRRTIEWYDIHAEARPVAHT